MVFMVDIYEETIEDFDCKLPSMIGIVVYRTLWL